MVKDSGVPVMCCGQKMTEIIPGTSDGSVEHPMVEAHYIEWVSLQTKSGNQRKVLKPGDAPEVCFAISEGDENGCNLYVVAVFGSTVFSKQVLKAVTGTVIERSDMSYGSGRYRVLEAFL